MSKTIIAKPGYAYMGRIIPSNLYEKGTKVIIPDGMVLLVKQDGKTLLTVNKPETIKINGKDVPGLKTKLLKKTLEKVELFVCNKSAGEFTTKIFKHELTGYYLYYKTDLKLADAEKFRSFCSGLKIQEGGNYLHYWGLEGSIKFLFNSWVASNAEYFKEKNKSFRGGDWQAYILAHAKDASEKLRETEAKFNKDLRNATGYDTDIKLVGLYD